MANELTVSLSVSYAKGNFPTLARALTALGINVSGDPLVEAVQSIGTAEEAINLGEVSPASGVAWFRNLDASNFIEIRTGTGGTKIVKLKPGEAWLFRFGSGVTAPYAIADTAACLLEYLIFPA